MTRETHRRIGFQTGFAISAMLSLTLATTSQRQKASTAGPSDDQRPCVFLPLFIPSSPIFDYRYTKYILE